MGMDIFGISPKLVGEKPEIDWENADDSDKKLYFQELEKWENNNPGHYFRANVWSWRPLNLIIDYVNQKYELNLETEGFGDNSGCGLDTQEDCDKLAEGLKQFLEKAELNDEEDALYLCLGLWIDETGAFIRNEDVEKELNEEFTYGRILQGSVISKDGNRYYPAWSTSVSHINEFILFLQHCGGFNIY
jgi:hypothetical protein